MNHHQFKDEPFVAMVLVRADVTVWGGTPNGSTAPTIKLYHS